MSLRVGLGVVTGQVPVHLGRTVAEEYQDILVLARLADEVGFDSIWVSEHHGAADSYLPSLAVLLAAIAAVSRSIELGTAVALAPFHNPIRFAEDFAVLDQISQGRVLLGVGTGWRPEEFEAFGIPIKERVRRTVELIQICREAWADAPTFSFSGAYFQCHDVSVTPKPFRSIPILLGGSAQKAIERAGRLADGFIATPMNSIATFRSNVETFDASAISVGRDISQLAIGFHTNAWITSDGEIDPAVRHPLSWASQTRYEPISPELTEVDEAAIRRLTLIGTPAELVDQAGAWVSGFQGRTLHAIFRLHYPGMPIDLALEAVRVFAAEVIPSLRRVAKG